jgi:hypothetical protein
MENELTMELYVSPAKERNIKKYGEHPNDEEQCICCGKLIKSDNPLHVHMNEH